MTKNNDKRHQPLLELVIADIGKAYRPQPNGRAALYEEYIRAPKGSR